MVRFFFILRRNILGFRPGISFAANDFFPKSSRGPLANAIEGRPFVYVIEGAHGRIKIGCTSNPSRRLVALRTASAFPLKLSFIAVPQSNDGEKIEHCAHAMLNRFRTDGEWFECSTELCVAALYGAASKYGEKLLPMTQAQADLTVATATGIPTPARQRTINWRIVISLIVLLILAYWMQH